MKKFLATVKITLRKSILDVQGKTVEQALHSLNFDIINNVRIGKLIELEVEAQNDGQAKAFADDACKKLLANTVIEDYQIEIEEL